jgi:kynurenine formamidase
VDFPIDKHPPTPQSTINDFPVHRLLLGQGIPLIENLINLHELVGEEFELWALPLKLKGGDGAATRAVALVA